jgi:hypothetical protein
MTGSFSTLTLIGISAIAFVVVVEVPLIEVELTFNGGGLLTVASPSGCPGREKPTAQLTSAVTVVETRKTSTRRSVTSRLLTRCSSRAGRRRRRATDTPDPALFQRWRHKE